MWPIIIEMAAAVPRNRSDVMRAKWADSTFRATMLQARQQARLRRGAAAAASASLFPFHCKTCGSDKRPRPGSPADLLGICGTCRIRERNRVNRRKPSALAQKRVWRALHPESRREFNRKYKERKNLLQRLARKSPRGEELRAKERLRWQKKQSDPKFRLHKSVAANLRHALRDQKSGRTWETIVGYSLDDLTRHLERQFKRGMTWDNYGTKWHVDHILPVSHFEIEDLRSPDLRACWALTNLRPLWKRDNLQKQAHRVFLL